MKGNRPQSQDKSILQKTVTGIVLAAGKGTRMAPLGIKHPKPSYLVGEYSILINDLIILDKVCQEIIIIVGYLKEELIKEVNKHQWKATIKYVEQSAPYNQGNGYCVKLARKQITSTHAILINADDLYTLEMFKDLIKHERAMIGYFQENWQECGVLQVDSNNNLLSIVEKPKEYISNICNINCCIFPTEDWQLAKNIRLNKLRNEFEITDLYRFLIPKKIAVLDYSSGWTPIGYAHSLLKANLNWLDNKKLKKFIGKEAKVADSSTLNNVVVGSNAVIGENCNISSSVIADGSIIGDNSKIEYSYIGQDIVLEDNTTIKATSEKDGSTVKVIVKDKLTDTGFKSLGKFID